jgi:hypothetical protein
MEFYNVNKLSDNQSTISSGIDITRMSKAFKIIDKKSNMKTMDDMIEFSIVFLDKNLTVKEEDAIFVNKDKTINFALVNEKSIIEIKDESGVNYYGAVHEGCFKTFLNKNELEKELNKQTISSNDEVVNKAINWLDNGRVGLSSATMCGTFFPQLKDHHKLKDKYDYDGNLEINHPHDNGDFSRCVKFLDAVPEVRARMDELKPLSKEWKNLVEKWDQIESLMKVNEDESYSLIRECLEKKKTNKP